MLRVSQYVEHIKTETVGQVVDFVEVGGELWIKIAVGGMCFITGRHTSFRGLDN